MTTQSQESHHSFFYRRNRVSPGENVPLLTKIRPGRWLHIQHLPPAVGCATSLASKILDIENAPSDKGSKSNDEPVDGDITSADMTKVELEEKNREKIHTVTFSHIQDNDGVATGSSSVTSGSPQVNRSDSKFSVTSLYSSIPTNSARRKLHHQDSSNSLVSVFDRDGGTVIFFIHGVGGSSSLWYYQMQYFQEQGFEIVAPDLFGHGFSDAPRKESAYSFYELAEDTLAIFDKYSKKRNILIGHSYGASFCTIIARERERKVTKMVLLSGGGPLPLEPQTCNIFCLPSCVLACLKPLLTDAFLRQAFHKPLPRVPSSDFSAFNVPSYVLRGTMQGQYWPEGGQDYHAAVSVAVLLIYGLRDEFVSLDETEWMHETIYASSLETVDAGHMVMLECPDRINHLIHQFIMKDMIIKPKRSSDSQRREEGPKGPPTPAPTRKKTMPNLMPGGLSMSVS